ncbi:hypothetical protein EBB07_29240 [Paenibacillaceae bacterium]|nr:hypothetical protein EBB07_29240 [Paenibacillaceae bacterium]
MITKDKIMIIEFEAPHGSFTAPKLALYNEEVITEDEVREIIKSGVHSDKVIVVDKIQYDNVFARNKNLSEG